MHKRQSLYTFVYALFILSAARLLRLHARALGSPSEVTLVEVGGAAVIMGRGEFNVRGSR